MRQRAETAANLAGVDAARAFFESSLPQDGPTLQVAHVDEHARCLHLASYEDEGLPVSAILSDAALLGSAGVILANRGSGKASPTHYDLLTASRRLSQAGEAMSLTVLDHLVLGGAECASMRRAGLL